MLLICPDCETSYEVAPADLGTGGRKVRCTSCGAQWHAVAHPSALDAVSGTQPRHKLDAGDGSPEVSSDDGEPVQKSEAPADPPEDVSTMRPLPALPGALPEDVAFVGAGEARRACRTVRGTAARKPMSRWAVAAAAGLALVIAGGMFRQTVVQVVPGFAGFYENVGLPVNVRGLAFRDVTTQEIVESGVPLLMVRGVIENVAGETMTVPRIRLAVRETSGREIFVWTAMPAKGEIQAGETLPFMAQLASPPADGRDVMVRFVSVRDAGQKMASR